MFPLTILFIRVVYIFTVFFHSLSLSAVRYLIVFVQFAMNCRSDPRLSWSCIWILLTTAQEVQAEVIDVNLQKTSTQTVRSGSDFEIPGIVAAVNESFEVGHKFDNDEGFTTNM